MFVISVLLIKLKEKEMKKVVFLLLVLTLIMSVFLTSCANFKDEQKTSDDNVIEENVVEAEDNLEKSKALEWETAKDEAGNPLFIETYVPTAPEAPDNTDEYPEDDILHWYKYAYPFAESVQLEQPKSPVDGCIGKKILVLKNGDHPYHTAYNDGAKKAADILNMDIEFMSANWDVNIQTQQVEQAINDNPDLIIYVPVDQETSVTHLRKIYDAKIPVIGSNSMPSNEGFQYLLCFCGPDDWGQTRLLAEFIADKADKKGGYCLVTHEPGGSAYYARAYGVITHLAEYAPDMKLLDMQAPGTDSADQTKSIVSDWITKFGQELKIIYTGETTVQATGSIEACKNASREDIFIGGIDNSGMALEYVKNGDLQCCTNQPPVQDGALPVLLAAKYFNGDEIETMIYMKPEVINKDNVDDFLPAQW